MSTSFVKGPHPIDVRAGSRHDASAGTHNAAAKDEDEEDVDDGSCGEEESNGGDAVDNVVARYAACPV